MTKYIEKNSEREENKFINDKCCLLGLQPKAAPRKREARGAFLVGKAY